MSEIAHKKLIRHGWICPGWWRPVSVYSVYGLAPLKQMIQTQRSLQIKGLPRQECEIIRVAIPDERPWMALKRFCKYSHFLACCRYSLTISWRLKLQSEVRQLFVITQETLVLWAR